MQTTNCRFCGGHLESQLVTRLEEADGRWMLIENVPALVCQQCGERYFTPQAHDRVVMLLSGEEKPVRTTEVEVFDARGAA
jgi:HTH-type transcriptional regulator / antitoxin MqsA